MKLLIKLFGKNKFVLGSPYEKKANLNNYYLMNVTCNNCKEGNNVYIKRGVYLNYVITGIRCRVCDCRLEKAGG